MSGKVDTGIEKRRVSSQTTGLKSKMVSITDIPIIDLAPMFEQNISAQEIVAKEVFDEEGL